jgi:hypothetical protein
MTKRQKFLKCLEANIYQIQSDMNPTMIISSDCFRHSRAQLSGNNGRTECDFHRNIYLFMDHLTLKYEYRVGQNGAVLSKDRFFLWTAHIYACLGSQLHWRTDQYIVLYS